MDPDPGPAGNAPLVSMLPELPAATGQTVPPVRTRRDSLYSLRNWTPTEDERCQSLSHMALLMPLYLSPMLYYRTVFTSCLYCLLLVLIMWALNSAPKPVIAVLHMVNLPMMNLMSTDELAAQYLTLDALLLVILLYLVVLVDSLSDLVKRIAYMGCSRYGLRRNGVFLSLCGATFLAAMVISTVVLCVPLLYMVDRVFSVIYKESMDQQLASDSVLSQRSSTSASNIATTARRDVENLFEKLAVYAHRLPKSETSLTAQRKQLKEKQQKQEKQEQQPPEQSESGPEGAPQGDSSGAGQPGADAVAAFSTSPPKENGLPPQLSNHVNNASCPEDETKAPGAAAEDGHQPAAAAENGHQPAAAAEDGHHPEAAAENGHQPAAAAEEGHQPAVDDNPLHGAGAEPNPGVNNEHSGEANDRHHGAGGYKHRKTADDKRAVASDGEGVNEDAAATKHGGKKDGHHGGRSKMSKKKSKRVGGRHNVASPDKTVAPAQADECQSPEAGIASPLIPEAAPNAEVQPGSAAAPNPETEAAGLVAPVGGGRPEDDSETAFESRRHGRKGVKGHKGHKKEAHHKAHTAKRAAKAVEATQAVEATPAVETTPAVEATQAVEATPAVEATQAVEATEDTKAPGTGTQAILKTAAQNATGVASSTFVGSPNCVNSPSSETQPEAAHDPSVVASPTGPAPRDEQPKVLSEKRALVIKENASTQEAAKQAPDAQKDDSPDEQSLTPAEAPAPALMLRRASILRQPGAVPRFGPAPGRGAGARRRASVVDFGAHKYAAYVPGDVVTKPRILSDTSLSNQSSASALAAPGGRAPPPRKSISLRYGSKDESRGARPSATQAAANEALSRKKRQTKRRADIHNAFLVGPSLMTVLGSLCSYWTGPAGTALTALGQDVPSPEPDMTASSWCVLTLPGSVAALLVGYCYLSWAHVLPYEPEDVDTEHSAALQTAFAKLKSLGTPSLAGALVVHCSVLMFVMCVPAGYIGSDIRLTLLSLLTWTALLVSAAGSLVAKTWPVVRGTWSKLPWGIIFVLGGVQVSSKVVEEYGLLAQLFKLFKPTFWTARSHIEVQAILATISSVLAETTNNRTLSLLMMPIVQDIAESKNMYPMYYAIPVVVGASSNVIMPISVPMVVMHEIGRVPFVRLVMLGIVLKMVLVGMVLLTVNAVGRTLYDWGNQNIVPDL